MKCFVLLTVLLFADVDLNPLEIQTIEPMFNAQSDVFYLLYTQSSPNGVRIGMNANEIRASTFNAAHPTRFLIHGWLNNQTATVNVLSIEAYLRRGNFNIIVVDWGAGAQTINYISARNRVNEVAPVVANFIDFLNLNGFISFDRLNVIGHSLGAHVAGITGKRVTRGRIQSIFALDPANPLFSLNAPDTRVAPTDAAYVEVIHTNGGQQGFLEPIGQADFFPNWGSSQPGCGEDATGGCAHGRVTDLFAESINTNFNAQNCVSFVEIQNQVCTGSRSGRMGGDTGNSANSGVYFMATNPVSPFSRG
ncbi:unnamed protein product [Diamesa tonsa]